MLFRSLEMASSHFYDLYRELSKSKVIDPAFMERMRVVNILLGRGVSGIINTDDRQLLEELLEKADHRRNEASGKVCL